MGKIKILIVEDESIVALHLKKTLERLGYTVIDTVASGEKAIKIAGEHKPELVLMDIMLEGNIDGIEAGDQIRLRFHIPVIYTTAVEEQEVFERAKITDPFGYMVKPFGQRELHMNIEMALYKHKMQSKLRQAKEEAEEATELKDKFVSLVSHDLRGPFSVIIGFQKLLLEDKKHPIHDKHRELIKRVVAEGERAISMIQKSLEISRLRNGKITPKPHFVNGCLSAENAIISMKFQAERKGINLICSVPRDTRIYADHELLNHVLANLISNAVKFSRRGDSVTIFVPSGEPTTLGVRDVGTGITKERFDSLFKYEETTSTLGTDGEKGTGLGLPLCRDIMESHQGKLDFKSEPGVGSEFYARFPFIHPSILIVDDDPDSRYLLQEALLGENTEILTAENGKVAMEMLGKKMPHLVITNVHMPIMDGFTLLMHIRKNSSLKYLPIIFLTADDQETTRERVFRLGANDFVSKPISERELIPRVRRYVG